MKAWKRNTAIAAVALLICAGVYLNWQRTESAADLTDTLDADLVMGESTLVMNQSPDALSVDAAREDLGMSVEEYFAEMRLSRQTARDGAVELLQETMSYGEAEETGKASEELTTIVSDTLAEAQIESLVIAKGYDDCVAYMADGSISVAVAAPENGLEAADAAVISDIVTSQTAYDLSEVRIIEVN